MPWARVVMLSPLTNLLSSLYVSKGGIRPYKVTRCRDKSGFGRIQISFYRGQSPLRAVYFEVAAGDGNCLLAAKSKEVRGRFP
ncbi:hypothetical protein NPIL_533941 [Nephila pilipes]|uniref:Secreted protein n=1 Tax=Nephila pilipes TaxID=299642 RepID=A0A8X6TWP0_NEPPI|nr:hypothetical protein NPIL_533941 [Nephila pilipes]